MFQVCSLCPAFRSSKLWSTSILIPSGPWAAIRSFMTHLKGLGRKAMPFNLRNWICMILWYLMCVDALPWTQNLTSLAEKTIPDPKNYEKRETQGTQYAKPKYHLALSSLSFLTESNKKWLVYTGVLFRFLGFDESSGIKWCNMLQWSFQEPKLEVPTIYKAYVREYPHKIWLYMVQYLHFRILDFPLNVFHFHITLREELDILGCSPQELCAALTTHRVLWCCGSENISAQNSCAVLWHHIQILFPFPARWRVRLWWDKAWQRCEVRKPHHKSQNTAP